MPVFQLGRELSFPPPQLADETGLLAVGGDLTPERLLLAYSQGIFPWYEDDLPILWHSPDPRMVLRSDHLHVSRSIKKAMRRAPYRLTLDTAFSQVISACAKTPRPGQNGTWITLQMQQAYVDLHKLGFAHSVEAWRGETLVGGLYGVSLGGAFFGESMFAHAADASKMAFVSLVRQLHNWGINLIDCQIHTDHLARFGAHEWPRAKFLEELERALTHKTRKGVWTFDSEILRPITQHA